MTWLTSICVLLGLSAGTCQLAAGQDTTGVSTDSSATGVDTSGHVASPDTGAYVPDTGAAGQQEPHETADLLHQGKVSISTTDAGTYQVSRDGSVIGATPSTFTQRRGTERVYSVQNSKGRVVCKRKVAITFAYEAIQLVCDPRTGKFGAPDNEPTYVDTDPPVSVDTAP